MQILLLGPLALRDPRGRPLDLGGPKRQAVLAALALELNQPLTVDRLLDLVWDGEPPTRARAALHGHIAALRKALPDGFALETLPAGYRLAGDPALVDGQVFADLRRRAQATDDPRYRSALLRQALGLWRGSGEADLPAGVIPRSIARRLHDERITVLEAWAECELRQGRGDRAVPLLEEAVRVDGLRESLVAALIRALFQAGRQAEALAAYHRAAALLRSEYGVHPGPALQAALDQVLSGSPVPAPAAPPVPTVTPSAPPSPPAPAIAAARPSTGPAPTVADGPRQLPRAGRLVGRAAAAEWLDRATRPRPGEVPLAVVVGPPGVGKTSLTVDWAHRVADRYPDGQLFADLQGFDEQDPKDPRDVLSGFLLALGQRPAQLPTTAHERAELFERLTRERRLLLVLDNVRSAEDVRQLLPAGEGCAVVVTSRVALLDLLAQDGAALHLLQPLTAEDAVQLLTSTVGGPRVAAEPAAARRLAELCDGLPLALRICGSRLAVRPDWTLAQLVTEIEDERTGLDGLDTFGSVGIGATLELTYRQLPAMSARLLALLGLYPEGGIVPGLAAALLGEDLARARLALGTLAGHHLIAEEQPGRYTCPGLVRRYTRHLLAETVGADRREAAFGRLLDFALAVSAATAERLTEYSWLVERPAGPAPVGVPAVGSAPEAEACFAGYEPALRALTLEAFRLGHVEHARKLAQNLGLSYRYTDPLGHWPELATVGLRAAEAGGSKDAVGRSTGQLGLALTHSGRPQEGLPHLERSVAIAMAAGDLRSLCVGQVRLALCYQALGRSPMACLAAWEAVSGCAHALDEPRVLAMALHNCSRLARECGDPERALHHVEQALGLDLAGRQDERYWLVLERARALDLLDRSDEALDAARKALESVLPLPERAFVGRELFVTEARELLAALGG
ncbi:BTAD domain-containing putative transcriptional regulator [Kitasatospora sp. NPDC052896]|uniref:AfsR/SARP family transcriptional regulator n=1 Tax=Kitasatospora sp. NPDC052896 TaxID=3364061 RepID=UPI0037C6605D